MSLEEVKLQKTFLVVGPNRDLEGRGMRIVQIYFCVLLHFLLKVAAFDFPS